jgi:hypothetical protein
LLIASVRFWEIAAHADALDHATKLTFSESIQIPGQILPAGAYLFGIANPDTGRNIVQVFSGGGTVPYATVQTVSAESPEPGGETFVTLAGRSGGPDVFLKGFYPGSLTRNEFLYSKQKKKELAQDKVQAVTVREQRRINSVTSAVGN